MRVEVFDADGNNVTGQTGELVCCQPFPSAPIGFYRDEGNQKYKEAYFQKFPNVWCHGDWIKLTEKGGAVIYGRSDATLNPGGIRIGTAEIYRQVEQFDQVLESLATEQHWKNDTRIILFLKMKDDFVLDENLIQQIKAKLKTQASPRHVPSKIIAVKDIPRTRSGKMVEIAVKHVINGQQVKNQEALANPEALAYFKNLNELMMD